MNVIVTGVSWTGRSRVGAALAAGLNGRFIRGADLWPRHGPALPNADDTPTQGDLDAWLDAIGFKLALRGNNTVVSCPALRRTDRDRIRGAALGDVSFVLLHGPRDVIEQRMIVSGMPPSAGRQILDRQFDALEWPGAEPDVISLDSTVLSHRAISERIPALLAIENDDDLPMRRTA